MADREPYKWITVKGKHIPVYKDEHGQDVFGNGMSTRERIEKQFIDKNSYMYSERYKELAKRRSDTHKELNNLTERNRELRKIIKEGSTLNPDDVKQFGKDMAEMFAEKTPEAKQAENELFNNHKREHELWENMEGYDADIDEYISQQRTLQKEQYLRDFTDTMGPAKDNYKHFQFDTGMSKYEDMKGDENVRIVEMSPQQYLKEVGLNIFGTTYERQVMVPAYDENVTDELYNLMQSGTKMRLPILNYRDKEQEGRHRAVAAMLHGDERIPVMIVLPKGRKLKFKGE